MARDLFEVLYLAIYAVYLDEEKGAHRPALQVVACHPAEGIRCPVALIEMRDGHRSKVIARLARVLLRLPRPEALLALATDCGLVERAIRSEEHTSELQSLMRISYAVFCLKKKTNQHDMTTSKNNSAHHTW